MTAETLSFLQSIVPALISGVVALLVASAQNNKAMAVIEYRLKKLEEKVDKHNNLVERMYKVEAELDALEK